MLLLAHKDLLVTLDQRCSYAPDHKLSLPRKALSSLASTKNYPYENIGMGTTQWSEGVQLHLSGIAFLTFLGGERERDRWNQYYIDLTQ